jgi:hypothetical protein
MYNETIVWIVLQHDYENTYIHEIFDSESAAEEEREKCTNEDKSDPPYGWTVKSYKVNYGARTVLDYEREHPKYDEKAPAVERAAKALTMYLTGDPTRIEEFRRQAQVAVEAAGVPWQPDAETRAALLESARADDPSLRDLLRALAAATDLQTGMGGLSDISATDLDHLGAIGLVDDPAWPHLTLKARELIQQAIQ